MIQFALHTRGYSGSYGLQFRPCIPYTCRWRCVIHGCVDSYSCSCRIVYLKCADNNRAETVLELFERSVEQLGLPCRVRADRGGENVDGASYMLEHPLHGPGRGVLLAAALWHVACGMMF